MYLFLIHCSQSNLFLTCYCTCWNHTQFAYCSVYYRFYCCVRNREINTYSALPFFTVIAPLWSSCISHTFTMSHWSSGQTIYFPPQGAAICTPGVQPTLWNWDYLLVPCRYSGDPDVIPDHHLWLVLFARSFGFDISHSSCPSSVLTAGHWLWRHTVPLGSRKAHTSYWGVALYEDSPHHDIHDIQMFPCVRNTVPAPHHDIWIFFGQEKNHNIYVHTIYVSFTICVKLINSWSYVRFRNFLELQ